MSLIVYGIKNCNTVKSALDWLNKNRVEFQFHDYKSKGITEAKLREWCSQAGWENLVNKRGTTWRQLPSDVQAEVKNEASAIVLMKEKTSVIKRPLLERSGRILTIGFDGDSYARIFPD